MRHLTSGLVCWLLAAAPGGSAELPDLGKLDRHIPKQPAYTAKQPLYGLLVFGPRADKRVWIVLDSSKPGPGRYDVLYVDRNADGDLRAPEKRLLAKSLEGHPVFDLPEFKDPATGAIHTDFHVRVAGDK